MRGSALPPGRGHSAGRSICHLTSDVRVCDDHTLLKLKVSCQKFIATKKYDDYHFKTRGTVLINKFGKLKIQLVNQ